MTLDWAASTDTLKNREPASDTAMNASAPVLRTWVWASRANGIGPKMRGSNGCRDGTRIRRSAWYPTSGTLLSRSGRPRPRPGLSGPCTCHVSMLTGDVRTVHQEQSRDDRRRAMLRQVTIVGAAALALSGCGDANSADERIAGAYAAVLQAVADEGPGPF